MKHTARSSSRTSTRSTARQDKTKSARSGSTGEIALGTLEGIARANGDFVVGLEHGMRVLEAFSHEHAELTLSEVASLTSLSPATARRSLFTLEALGYIGRIGRKFLLKVKVMALTSAYLTAIDAQTVLQPFLQELVDEVGGSSSVTVLNDLDILYIAHASKNRAIRLGAGVGARYPAYATSMGRVLLAHRPPHLVDDYFKRAQLTKLTDKTEVSPRKLRGILEQVRTKGHAVIEDELDYGLVSVAAPICGPNGMVVAAVNCSDVTSRLDAATLARTRLAPLRAAAKRIEMSVLKYPVLANSVLDSSSAAPPRKDTSR